MKKRVLIIITTAIIFALSCIFANAENYSDRTDDGAEFDESTILAIVKPNLADVSLFSAGISFEELGISEVENMDMPNSGSVNLFSAENETVNLKLTLAEPGRDNVLETIEKLKELPYVELAEPNYIYTAVNYPNDTYYNTQYALEKISAQAVWDMNIDCSDVVVAVIDSGVMITHPDLKDNIWVNPGETPGNGIDDDKNGYIDDVNGWDFYDNDNDPSDERGHGTHAAGIVSASTNNGKGVASIARDAKILPLRVLGADGKGSSYAIYQAIMYVKKMGIPIVNNSYSGETESTFIVRAIKECNNSLFAFAAGNDASDNDAKPVYPASTDSSNIIAVASTDQNDCLSDFSNYGASSVDIAAPGTDIASTYYNAGSAAYAKDSGTSMACPMVAGAAAVVKAKHPDMTPEDIIKKLEDSADRLDSLNGKVKTGRLNAYEAVSIHAESVSLSSSSLTTNKYKKIYLGAEIIPADTTDAIIWTSSNTNVVSIDNGIATAKETGTATVTLTCGALSAECTVTVLEPEICSVILNTNGGTLNQANNIEYTCGIGLTLPVPEKTGYTFAGWYESEEYSGESVDKITAEDTGDKTYYAKWLANTYNVTLNTNGGEVSKITSYIYGTGLILPSPEQKGYTFNGWYDNESFSGKPIEEITADDIGDKTYYAKWTADRYNITLNTNDGGTTSYVMTHTYGTTLDLPVSERTGYTFDGWYDNKEFAGEPVSEVAAYDIGDKIYYAKWTANTYNIMLNTNGGAAEDVTAYTYGIGIILPVPQKIGYTFNGWYESADFTGETIAEITEYDIGDKTYHAKWEANTYSITLNTNGGTSEAVVAYTYGVGAALPTPEKSGHTFDGWYESADFSGGKIIEITAEDIGDKTYYAKWTAHTYTIRFLNDDLSELYSNEFAFGTMPEYAEPTKPGDSRYSYEFTGWNPPIAEVTGTAEYVAEFSKIPTAYFIEYNNGGAVVSSPDAGKYCVIFASYKDGALLSAEIKNVIFEKADEITVYPSAFSEEGADMVNVMLWMELNGLVPLCSSDSVKKQSAYL